MSAKGSAKGVVNPDLTVKGIKNLRVVDASVLVSILFGIMLSNGFTLLLLSLTSPRRTPSFQCISLLKRAPMLLRCSMQHEALRWDALYRSVWVKMLFHQFR